MGLKLNESQREELKKRVLTVADFKLSCIDVLEQYATPKSSGDSVFFECPNGCNGKGKLTSCSVPRKSPHFYKCFKCGESGNAIKLRSFFEGRRYFDIAIEEAYRYSVITQDEYDYLTYNHNNSHSPVKKMEKKSKPEVKPIEEKAHLASAEVLNFVYSELLALPEFALTEECEYYLRSRGVEDLDNFYCHHEDFDMKQFVQSLQKKRPEFKHSDFYGVPGFFFRFSNEEKTKGSWRFLNKAPHSVLIVVKDAKGNIIGLQCRNIAQSDSRYYWISSSSENTKEECGFGTSPGSPVHVQYPEVINSGFYTFTEGFFKVRKLASCCKSIGFSLQGMNNSKTICKEVRDSMKSPLFKERMSWDRSKERKKLSFNFFFDADMIAKYQVYFAAKSCYQQLKQEFPSTPARFHVWPMHFGKGFDDLLEQTPDWREKIVAIKGDLFVSIMDEQIEITRKSFPGMTLAEINADPEKGKEFRKKLYQSFWKRVS